MSQLYRIIVTYPGDFLLDLQYEIRRKNNEF